MVPDGSEKIEDKSNATADSGTESTIGILKFLPPSQDEWRELNPMVDRDDENFEIKKRQASESRALKETLLAALQMPNIIVFAGSGTSLGSKIGGPSMWDLWDYAMHENPPTNQEKKPTLREESKAVISNVGYNLAVQGH